MNNAVVYTRVSTTEQATNGHSLGGQKKDCLEFAVRNNYKVLEVFEEQGESAKTIDRSELQRMMEYCAKNKKYGIKALILWKIDRLARNMEDYHFLNSFFNKLGIQILSATEINDNSPVGKLTRNILGAFAQFENDQKSERVKNGMQQALSEGKWIWKAPYGYKLINGDLFQDEEKAPVVKRIYELFATGLYRQSQIREILKKENIEITPTQIFYILRKSIYCGKIYSTLADNPVKGDFEPIVSEELFNKVQNLIFGSNPVVTSYIRNNPEFPLKQFILCPFCGCPLTASKSTGRKNKRYSYYHCYNKNCKSQVRIKQDKLEMMFLEYLTYIKPDEQYAKDFKKCLKEAYNKAIADTKNRNIKLNNDLKSAKEKKDRVVDFYLEGKLTDDIYNSKLAKIEDEIQHIKLCLSESELPKDDFDKCVNTVFKALENIEKVWESSDLDTKQRLQQLIFPKGLVYENNGFRTGQNSIFFTKKGGSVPPDFKMVPPSEFESLPTP